jgi:putative sporulation protein YyaC
MTRINAHKVEKKYIAKAIIEVFPEDMTKENTIFVCVGTDRSTGDSLAPLVGTKLKRKGYRVLGTINDPVHALNLADTIENLPEHKYIVGIDACLGQASSVGQTQIFKGKLRAGAGVGKSLPEFGDYVISPVVNVGGFMEYFVLQNTRLSVVLGLADSIYKALNRRFDYTKQLVAATSE